MLTANVIQTNNSKITENGIYTIYHIQKLVSSKKGGSKDNLEKYYSY